MQRAPDPPVPYTEMDKETLRAECLRLRRELTEEKSAAVQQRDTITKLEEDVKRNKRMAVAAEQKSLARLETLQAQLQSRVEELQQKQREFSQLKAEVARLQQQVQQLESLQGEMDEAAAVVATTSDPSKDATICSLQQEGNELRAQLSANTSEEVQRLGELVEALRKDCRVKDDVIEAKDNTIKQLQELQTEMISELQAALFHTG